MTYTVLVETLNTAHSLTSRHQLQG